MIKKKRERKGVGALENIKKNCIPRAQWVI
jgi:hypothetical protein